MQEEHNPYNELGFRRVNSTPFYPIWKIEVTVNDRRTDDYRFGAANSIDLKQKMIELSLEYPGKTVSLIAFARVRMVMLDGRMTKQTQYGSFYESNSQDVNQQKIYDKLICADYNGEDKFIFPNQKEE